MILELLNPLFCVYKLPEAPPAEIMSNEFCFFIKSGIEYQLICPEDARPDRIIPSETDLCALKMIGQSNQSDTGVLSHISSLLTQSSIRCFSLTISDSNYLFIKEEHLYPAYLILQDHQIEIRGIETLMQCVTVVRRFLSDIEKYRGNMIQTAYLTGSSAYDDFHPGFSDLDFFFIANRTLTDSDFDDFHNLYARYRALGDEWFSALEGEILSPESLETANGPTVYWGTSRDRFLDHYTLSGFSMRTLLDRGILLCGPDLRKRIPRPNDTCILKQSAHLLDTVKQYAAKPDVNPHYADWIFLMCQTLYTLSTGKQTSKTRAARWFRSILIDSRLISAIELAESIRFNPNSANVEIITSLREPILKIAGILEETLQAL